MKLNPLANVHYFNNQMYSNAGLFTTLANQILQDNHADCRVFYDFCLNSSFAEVRKRDPKLAQCVTELIHHCEQEPSTNYNAMLLLSFMYTLDERYAMSIVYLKYIVDATGPLPSVLTKSYALNSLAYLYANELGCSGAGFQLKSRQLFEEATYLNNPYAYLNLAEIYYIQGLYAHAVELYEHAISLGDDDAMVLLADMYRLSRGVQKNLPKAIELYKNAILLGNSVAMTKLAQMYERGFGFNSINYTDVFSLYLRAIDWNDYVAMHRCALLYLNPDAGIVNEDAAVRLLKQAIELGYITAVDDLSAYYESKNNISQVIYWYEFSCRQLPTSMSAYLRQVYSNPSLYQQKTQEVLELLWNDLVEGKEFSLFTLQFLNHNAKELILEKMLVLNLDTSVTFLKKICFNLEHPVTRILNDLNTSHIQTSPLKQLKNSISTMLIMRATFFYTNNRDYNYKPCFINQIPKDVKKQIMSFIYSGSQYDKETNYSPNYKSSAICQALIK